MINEGYDQNQEIFPKAGPWNKAYTYEHINLWTAEAWKDRYSPISGLARWIQEQNHRLIRERARSGKFAGRKDGAYDSKTCSLTYPDVVGGWDKKGLFYKCTEMGGVCWIAMLPHAVRDGRQKDPAVLVVLHDADYTDPNWAMDTLEFYREYNEMAAREGWLVLYVAMDGPDQNNTYMHIMQELSAIFHLKMGRVYLDVSTLSLAGCKLSDGTGFVNPRLDGSLVPDPEEAVEHLCSVPVLNITGRWQDKVSLLYRCISNQKEHPAFHLEKHIHSACGRRMAEGMSLEHVYPHALDPELLRRWEAMGLRFESHDHDGEQWLSLAPCSAYGEPDKMLPVMLIFHEVSFTSTFLPLMALSDFYEYCDLIAQGQLICLFFALETPDDNDLFMDILRDAAKLLPIDMRRVYVTGHSHNGHFAAEFMRRHPKEIAAVATLGNSHGLPAPAYSQEVIKITDEMVDRMSAVDMPLININGTVENEFLNYNLDTPGFQNAVNSWQRRLKAFNCAPRTYNEIAAARTSPNLATRMVGVPNDGAGIQFRYGCDCYIADITNNAGKNHLRLVTLENLPHMPAPQMPELTWDFVRRFARNLETGEVVELYSVARLNDEISDS